MKITNLIFLFLLAGLSIVKAQSIIVNPYLQSTTNTSIVIMWEADNTGAGEIEWGLDPFSLNSNTISTSVVGSGSTKVHTAQLTSLSPNTKYYYKVKMAGGQLSSLSSFKTLSNAADEASSQFFAMSDMQRDGSHPNKFNEIVDQGVIPISLTDVGPSLNDIEGILIPGDLVVTGGSYNQWKDYFFLPGDSLFARAPIYPVLGNHEYHGSGGLQNFQRYFNLPMNGPSGLEEQCWYKDVSNVRLIGFDFNTSGANKTAQLDWLSTTLNATCTNSEIDFVFAMLHHPHKSELWTPGESGFTGDVIDSLEQFTSDCGKASLHLFGHTHGYSRGQSRDHEHLWINVASAGGAIDNWGEFPNADYEEFVKSQDEYGFVLLDVKAGNDPMFTITRYSRGDQDVTLNNPIRDEVTIIKNEFAPAQPYNIFPDSDTVTTNCILLQASQFYGVEDTIQASHWQISRSGDFVDSLVAESWYQSENFYYEVNLQANDDLTDASFSGIVGDTIYEWRVRYRDQFLKWSPWSLSTEMYIDNAGDTLSPNMLLNNDAENGISSWTGDIESLLNAECNSVAPYAGNSNFGVGGICQNESNVGIAYQNIDLSLYSAAINAGTVSADFGGFMRDFSGSDLPEIYLEFYNGSTLLYTTPTISNQTSTWTFKQAISQVPINTNDCRFVLKGTRNAGSDNDSYFDNLSFYLVTTVLCPDCLGGTNNDSDKDGYCDDIDCDDSNENVYPGALELCDGLDNNCDGIADAGTVVTWTGTSGDDKWGNPLNWDQGLTPLPCQHVVIDLDASVQLDSVYTCRSLSVTATDTLTIMNNSQLVINGNQLNTLPSANISGVMHIYGKCDVKKSSGKGFEVFGVVINHNKVTIEEINANSIEIKTGGRFESPGCTLVN